MTFPVAFFPYPRLCSRARAFESGSGRSHSVALTTFSPVLIAARIMWMNSRVKSYRSGGGHWEVVETLVQSAAVYSAALASLLGTYLAGSNAQYVCLDILQPLIVSPASDVVVIVRLTSCGTGRCVHPHHYPCRFGLHDERGLGQASV